MPEIQEKVEHFRQRFQPSPLTDMHGFDTFAKQYYDLLRKVVEECCKVECPLCAWGHDLIEKDKPDEHFYHHEELMVLCQAWEIRRHFAWMEK